MGARRLGVITIDYVIVFLAGSSTTAQAAKNVLSQSNIASILTTNIGAKITAAVSAGTIAASVASSVTPTVNTVPTPTISAITVTSTTATTTTTVTTTLQGGIDSMALRHATLSMTHVLAIVVPIVAIFQ